MSKYTDGEIREKYESYNDCYENIVQILNDILDAGELTEGSQERLQEAYDDYNEEYAETKEVLNSKEDKSLEDQIKDLTNNKLDADIDSIMSILTKNGERNTFYMDEDGNLFVDGEQIPELNTVKLTVDEQNKKIEALVSEGTVEINGEKVKLNVAYSQILQTVDGINQTVAKLNKNIEKNYSTTEQMKSEIKSAADSISLSVSNLKSTLENNYSTTEQMKSEIKLSADGIKSEVRKYKETLDRATMEVTNEFYVSTSREEPTGGEWVKTLPTGQTKGYIWTRTVTKTTSGATVYGEPYCLTGAKGEKGDQGLQGLQGEKGEQGIPGKDGRTTYFHIKYSAIGNPTSSSQMTETPDTYIGTYVDFEPNDSDDPTKYTWYMFKGLQGEKGEQGIPGKDGDGRTTYLHIKYSNDGGQTFTSNNGEDVGDYIGTCTDFTKADPTTVSSYTWARIKGNQGEQGLQGIQGEKGEQGVAGKDGKTTYFHIKYSSVSNPQYASQMSEIPNIYIGTYVDFTQADSNNPSDYTWYRFQGLQGEKGEQGIPGVGKDGKTSYLHIKYSNDGGRTFTSNNGETVGIYIGTCTDFNQNDPTYVGAYTWNKMKGDTGAGVKEVVNLYFIHTSKTVAPSINSSGWDTKIPAYIKGKYLWKCLKVVYTDNTISYTTPQYAPEWESKQIADEAYSLVTQTNNKISWLVKSGESESDMELTDKMYSLMTKKVLVEAKKIELTGSVNINEGTFLVQTNGNLKIGGLTGRLNGDGTQQGIFEVTSKGKVYSRNLDSANIYSAMDDGVLEVRNGDIRFRVNSNGIQIKNFGTGGGELTMDDKNITADSLTASGKVIAKGGLRSNSYVRGMSLAINNKKFNGDSSTINGSSQSRLFLGDTLIIYGRSSFTKLTANTTKTNEITFDKVGFVNPPVVIATTNSSSPNQCRIGAGSVTTTGFNLYLNRTNTTDTTVFWVAIGERAGSDTFVS